MQHRNIIVMGSSQGGTGPLTEIVRSLSPDLQAAVFIVRHLPPESNNYLVDILAKATSLPVVSASHCETIQQGTIHVAPANRHLLINTSLTFLSDGPHENMCRPAIDPLFRSAAVAYGPRVIGIVLSGELDDGTPGLQAIKECGGLAIVQDPATACSPSMPESALEDVIVDYSLPPPDIGTLINGLVRETVPADFDCPAALKKELEVLTGTEEGIRTMEEGYSTLIPVGCPTCGGPLWEVDGQVTRYRCHIGHAFTGRSVVHGLRQAEEQALYAALRALEERVRLLRKLTKSSGSYGSFNERIRDAETYAQQLRGMLHMRKGEQWKC